MDNTAQADAQALSDIADLIGVTDRHPSDTLVAIRNVLERVREVPAQPSIWAQAVRTFPAFRTH